MAALNKRPPEGVSFEGNAFHLQITGLHIVYMNSSLKANDVCHIVTFSYQMIGLF